ncbi:hypothetical protein T10_6594 [Trichinella papuae]|uniref:Uncharacterized protein n=1 Tax=Trichinella papuae TaxID=268474 RepID=A0A0V1N1D3_9BILA|nr:hypothetical protein T10_6594 [Trichinella papuae]
MAGTGRGIQTRTQSSATQERHSYKQDMYSALAAQSVSTENWRTDTCRRQRDMQRSYLADTYR